MSNLFERSSSFPYQFKRNTWPEYLQEYKELKGIWINRCIFDNEIAHAHPDVGYICLDRAEYIQSKFLMLHELAHILTNSNHNKRWRRKLIKLGGTLDSFLLNGQLVKSYHKVIRRHERLDRYYE